MNYKSGSKWASIKYAVSDFFNKNKWLIIVLGALLLLALLTGVFTAIKLYNLDNDMDLEEYSMYTLIDGSIYSFKYLLLRLLSCFIVLGLLYVFSLTKYLYVFGFALVVYRAFLITLNVTLIVIRLGISGVLTSLLIILPCQVACVAILALLFVLLMLMTKSKKECSYIPHETSNAFVVLLLAMVLVCVVEAILLLIFRPTTILII